MKSKGDSKRCTVCSNDPARYIVKLAIIDTPNTDTERLCPSCADKAWMFRNGYIQPFSPRKGTEHA